MPLAMFWTNSFSLFTSIMIDRMLSQIIIILTIVLITRSGNAVFTISGGSAVYSSRSNFTEFDTNNLEHKSAFKIDHNSNSVLIQNR